jgi:transposase InsO family protein
MDITYLPIARSFVYLTAVIDWFSRKVLAWRLSVALESGPCIEALKEAMRRHGRPEIMNTDQGSQFTSNGSGGRSNTRRSICAPMTASRPRVRASLDI